MATSLEFVPADIFGSQTTGGTAEEAMTLQLNGAVAAASIAVPVGERWEISTLQFTAEAAARFLLQKTVDGGANWYSIHPWRQPQDGSGGLSGPEPIALILGGALVAIRMRVQTPSVTALCSAAIRVKRYNS
jgi:hypothetical protein